jgi:hypothetical protein
MFQVGADCSASSKERPADFVSSVINPQLGGSSYGQRESFDQIEASEVNGHREGEGFTANHDASGLVNTTKETCGNRAKAGRRLQRMHELVAQFFLLWSPQDSAPIDPIRQHSFSSRLPRGSSANQPPVLSPPPRASAASWLPSLAEIHANLISNLAHTKFVALWEVSGRPLVLIQDCVTGSSLAVPFDQDFCVATLRAHIRACHEQFGVSDAE